VNLDITSNFSDAGPSYIKGRSAIESISEEGVEENIWEEVTSERTENTAL
jgi:hypothetical protein